MLAIFKFFLAMILSLSLFGCLGCKNQQSYEQTMTFLQQGKARGHLTVTSDGRFGGTIENAFTFGASKSVMSFDGDVNFSDQVRHVSESSESNDDEASQ